MFSKRYFYFSIFVILSLFHTLNAQDFKVNKSLVFPLQNQHVHSSSLVELTNGDILVVWFQGSGERKADDVKIMGSRLKFGSNSWESPFEMADTPNIPDCNPVLYLNEKHELYLFYVAVRANKWENAILRYKKSKNFNGEGAPIWNWQEIIIPKPSQDFASVVESKFKEYASRGLSWAAYAPQYEKMLIEAAKDLSKVQEGWMSRTQPIKLKSGRILLPLYSDGFNFSILAYSDDFGNHWEIGEPLVGYGNVQPSLFEKENGDIISYMRDNGDKPNRILKASSKDQGVHWTVAIDTDIPNPGASIHGVKRKNGDWVMVFNNLENGRNNLSWIISKNEGETWSSPKIIEESTDKGDSFSYPTIIESKKGDLLLTYSYHIKGEGKSIRFVKLIE